MTPIYQSIRGDRARIGWMGAAMLAFALSSAAACSAGRRASLGGECEVNSDCNAPLVCRIGFCRNECATSADCAAGLSCLLDENRLGICQLLEEASCTLPSECSSPLVCRFNQCTNPCNTDRDCLGGARCRIDPAGNACVDPSSTPCVRDGECARREFCLSGRCRQQCFTDRDCRRGWRCSPAGECLDPSVDGGPPDAPAGDAAGIDVPGMDAPMGDAPIRDAPVRDAGPLPGTTCMGGTLRGVVSFDGTSLHACAITNDGMSHLYCWGSGRNLFGTAAGALSECATEITALRGTDMVQVATSANATCVRSSAGAVTCVGDNSLSELGRGTTGTAPDDHVPMLVPMLNASRLVAGLGQYFCAMRGGMLPQCWGDDSATQLGDPPFCGCSRPSPVDATEAAGASLLHVGYSHTCFLTPTRGVDCFGSALFMDAALGRTDVTAIAAGSQHTCVLTATGMECWGANMRGALGDGTIVARATPTPVVGLPSVPTAITAGNQHTCALLASGDVYCWGSGGAADLVLHAGNVTTPRLLFSGASAIDAGNEWTCGLVGDELWCAGVARVSIGYGTGPPLSQAVPVQLL